MTLITYLAGPLAALAVMLCTAGLVIARTPSRMSRSLHSYDKIVGLHDDRYGRRGTLRTMMPNMVAAGEYAVATVPVLRKGAFLARIEPWLTRQLVRADISITSRELVLIGTGLVLGGGAAGYLVWGTHMMSAVVALACLCGLAGYIRFKQQRRLHVFGEQLPEVLAMLTISLRAGYSTMQALDAISKQVRAPAGQELATVVRESHLGVPPEQALRHLAVRVNNEDLHLLVNAIAIQHDTGGNLISMVETIEATVRERVTIRGEVRALTAQATMGGWIITLLPVVLAAIFFMINPDGMSFFWTDWIGAALGGVAIVSTVAGNIVLRRIARVEL